MPIAKSEASEEMWKGRDQLGPLKTGACTNFSFNVSKDCWQAVDQENSLSLARSQKRGAAILEKFSMNLLY